jgi:hypothetical protein
MKTVKNICKVLVGKHKGHHMEDYVDGTLTSETDLKERGQDSV